VWSERGPLRYERLTWPEVRRAAGRVVLLPAIPHGDDPHHMDFPGAITIGWDTFTRYLTGVGRSLVHHGFRRMLSLNGHGSNQNLVEMAARLVMVERPEVLAAAAFHLASPEALAVVERVRDSTRGGMAHACELETSIYLAIDPDAVDMDLAVDERGYPEGEHAWLDWSDGSLKLMPCGRRSAAPVCRATPPRRPPPRAGSCWRRRWPSASATSTSCSPSRSRGGAHPRRRCGERPGAVTVRHATVDDAPALGRVHVRAWQAAYRGQMPDDYLEGLRAEERAAGWERGPSR